MHKLPSTFLLVEYTELHSSGSGKIMLQVMVTLRGELDTSVSIVKPLLVPLPEGESIWKHETKRNPPGLLFMTVALERRKEGW